MQHLASGLMLSRRRSDHVTAGDRELKFFKTFIGL